ncbi:MAG: glycosyltransferase family 39 protein [Natronomonas sp.]|nr:glycosyltransferase family 39 protein [Natronomonas sp.]
MSPPSPRPRIRRLANGLDATTAAAAAVATTAGLAVLVVSITVFAYHSSNHDEGVYLLQAAMLLQGQLELHAGDLAGAFHPWFFVEDAGRLYPKYAPVPAAMFAASMALFGEPRVTLAVVAAANAALVYALGSMASDRRAGVVAAILFSASPLALVTTSAFLPYAPTTALNLVFAVAYLRSVRDESAVVAAVAGGAIGLAFFARPLTAVLFAIPFVLHALFSLARSLVDEGAVLSGVVRRRGLTALVGLAFVGVALAYNARMTGSPLVFPYEAFAPRDGPGFGTRRILGHSVDYTPQLALEANGYALYYLATRWFVAGPIGTALAAVGLALAARSWLEPRWTRSASDSIERTAGLLLAGPLVTVPLGNLFFWGNYNLLATMSDPTDGLVSQFGPFYHFDLLLPLSVFAAVAAVAAWDQLPALRGRLDSTLSPRAGRAIVAVVLVASLVGFGVTAAAAVSTPLDRNAAYADKYEIAYEPIETADLEDALVFLPTPYGEWQNHPFQYLRNDGGLDGSVVYALDREPDEDFAVLDAYPNRTTYRYAYRGEWTPNANRHVTPKLEAIEVRRGTALSGDTVVGVPPRVEYAMVRLESRAGGRAEYAVADPGESIAVPWSVDRDAARLGALDADSDPSIRVGEDDVVVLTITLTQPDGGTLTYRQETTVRTDTDGVEAVWPPERSVCPLVTDCGNEGTYLPDEPDSHRDGVSFETSLTRA